MDQKLALSILKGPIGQVEFLLTPLALVALLSFIIQFLKIRGLWVSDA